MNDKIRELTIEFFENLGVKYDSINVNEKEENIFFIKVETPESGKVIGPHGRNLEAINTILKIIILKNITENDKFKLYIEVNDYLKSKDDRLKDLIISKIKYVEKTGNDLKMPFYSAYDRKKIHSIVADYGNENIFTKSIGEGKDRRIYICKTEKKLSIDIDSLGI